MKITLFTSDNNRHHYLINLLSSVCENLYVIQEVKLKNKNQNIIDTPKSDIIKKYFNFVDIAQNKFFENKNLNKNLKKIKTLKLDYGKLSAQSMSNLFEFLSSDIYIVFGSSFIRGDLIDYLIEKRAINIHAGVSPYYRGTDCNFWALFDNNPHLVGSTIHMLSKGLDSGPILYHAMSNLKQNPFEYTMSTIKSAFHSITERIKDETIFKINPILQDKKFELRYSKKKSLLVRL